MLTTRIRRLLRPLAIGPALRVALACCLLAAETFAVVHPVDLAAHSGEHCYICIGVASLGSAVVGEIQTLVVDAASPALTAPVLYAVVAAQLVPQVARGPPRSS